MITIAAIAWDIDGTLVDSEPLHHAVLLEVCDAYGLHIGAMPEDRFRGVHLLDVWATLAPLLPAGTRREAWTTRIVDRYVARAGSLVPLPGAREAVAAFAAHGLRQVCVSNSNRRIVDANIRALGLEDTIAFSISLDDVAAGKPDPEPYRGACAALGLPPGRVLAVEDSATGAASARAAGLVVVGLDPAHVLPDLDVAVETLEDLPARLLNAGFALSPSPSPPAGV